MSPNPLTLPFALLIPVLARDITFPPTAGINPSTGNAEAQTPLSMPRLDDVDIVTGSAFSGLTTYAHLPYTNCFVETDEEKREKYDIAILGAPFDTVSCVGGGDVCLIFSSVFFFWMVQAGGRVLLALGVVIPRSSETALTLLLRRLLAFSPEVGPAYCTFEARLGPCVDSVGEYCLLPQLDYMCV